MIRNPLAFKQTTDNYRWVILALCAFTPMLVVTLPNMSIPPLLATIGDDIGLSLVQMGTIWGTMSFTGIFFALIGGTLGDRFGTRRTLFVVCLMSGLLGVTRAFAVDFVTLMAASLLFGVFQTIIPVVVFKVARQWFPPEQLGTASGFISAGFATGLLLGPLLSTSVILPAFGGWRQVLWFYGVIAVIMSLLWLIIHPPENEAPSAKKPRISFSDSLRHVMGLRDLWIVAFGGLGVSACFHGFTGYLPTYLKAIGWAELDADRALAAFFVTSLAAVVPLTMLSDRLHLRRGFLVIGAFVLAVGIGSLSVVEGVFILVVVAATGLVFDSFMAIQTATVLEVDGVGHLYAGTALGFATTVRYIGGAFSPPLGNSFASIELGVPFLFWGGMALITVAVFLFIYKPKAVHSAEEQTPVAEPV